MTIENSITEVFKKTWNIFTKQFVTLILGILLAFILMIFVITIPPLIFGMYILCIKAAQGKKIKITDIFEGFNYFFRSWGLVILTFLIIALGFILLIIPGLYLIVILQYIIVVSLIENKGITASIKRSFQIGNENLTFSIILAILLMIIGMIGSITRIGFIITTPFTTLATVVATMHLIKITKDTTDKKDTKPKKKKGKK